MNNLRKLFSTLILSVVLFLTLLFNFSGVANAAIAPDEAQNIMRDAGSLQEAGQKLREADSSEKLRNNEALNTAKEVRKDRPAIDAKGNTIEEAKEGLKGVVENVKEKLNLDEPIPEATKEFLDNPTKTVREGR